ncbi:lytic murein transglycosylase B [Desulfobulbus oligotrophicus]|uniref:Lytic murein transglycosylase B n=1 Tax=Desulfobulbus oligotrophicus TaxID=1909699 RepID=A0A7T5VAZ8_9BACT|nr:lytic murein transglycosylase B [Desulfobulbus oligotrophicus]QQG64534.1 lytic murein transglycosylase B [Desulfobulbus oligotrophicus]
MRFSLSFFAVSGRQQVPCFLLSFAALRRQLLLCCLALTFFGLSACADQPVYVASPKIAQPPLTPTPAPPACVGSYHAGQLSGDFAGYPDLEEFVELMVQKHGFEREYLFGLLSQARRKDWTLNYYAQSDQATKRGPTVGGWTSYRAKFLHERHINAGVAFARRHQAPLQRAARMYGVPQEYILGILAVETNFGAFVGKDRVLDALTTLGFDYRRRGEYFRGELESFLLMTRKERMDPARPVGSFAGAMGLGQFMPTSFLKWAVDFNGDGRKDLWDPEDAIGSIANYFVQHGWQPGQAVVTPLHSDGRPVLLKPGYDSRYSLAELRQAGLTPVRPCSSDNALSLLLLRHQRADQYLIGHPNFYTITRYNNSTYYAMAVHELAVTFKKML